jgi:hypothetical protein
MSKIQYPTVDLFIYNLIEESKSSQFPEKYWKNLSQQLKDNSFSTKINDEDAERLDFWNTISSTVDGCYSQATLDDTICLRYSCSFDDKDDKLELSEIASTITQLKDLAILPKVKDLPPGRLSEDDYLGQTWMISGWTVPDNSQIAESIAHEIYKALINQEYQYQQTGEFLGATVWEMWRGEGLWEGIEQDSHVIVIFYPEQAKFAEAAKYYNAWRYLFSCRHKIIWAYEQGRELKLRLLKQFKNSRKDNSTLSKQGFHELQINNNLSKKGLHEIQTDNSTLSEKGLHELKADLQTNINALSSYVYDINLLQVQQHTVDVNLGNYEKQRQKLFPSQKFLEEFSKIVKDKYQVQLEKDYLSFNPGLAILENVTDTIRGMVEIEQAQRDRRIETQNTNFQNAVAVIGVAVATASFTASIVSPFVKDICELPSIKPFTAKQPLPEPMLNLVLVLLLSLGLGWLAGLFTQKHLKQRDRSTH